MALPRTPPQLGGLVPSLLHGGDRRPWTDGRTDTFAIRKTACIQSIQRGTNRFDNDQTPQRWSCLGEILHATCCHVANEIEIFAHTRARRREFLCPEFLAGIPGNFSNSGGNYGEFIGVFIFFQFLLLIMTFFCVLTHALQSLQYVHNTTA